MCTHSTYTYKYVTFFIVNIYVLNYNSITLEEKNGF